MAKMELTIDNTPVVTIRHRVKDGEHFAKFGDTVVVDDTRRNALYRALVLALGEKPAFRRAVRRDIRHIP